MCSLVAKALIALAVVLAFASHASAGVITLAWDPTPTPGVVGYVVSYGTAPGVYPFTKWVGGNQTTAAVTGLNGGQTYYFVVTAYFFDGTYSTASNETSGSTPNAAPVVPTINNQQNLTGEFINLPVAATDPDGDTLVYSATGLPLGVTIDAVTGNITGWLPHNTAGSYSVTVTVSDGWLTATRTFTWTVTYINRAPEVAPLGNVSTMAGDPVSFQVVAWDADQDALSFQASSLPAGLALNASTGLITGSPSAAGQTTVTVTAGDGVVSTGTTFTWTVVSQQTGATVKFVQGGSIRAQGQFTDVAVPLAASQRSGDLNLVAVAWQSAAGAQIQFVIDSFGNTYQLAAAATSAAGVGTQAIYYANRVAAALGGVNQVFVSFNGVVTQADVRVAEYQGVLPANVVDGTASATGSGTSATVNIASVPHGSDFLVAAISSQTGTLTPGAGYESYIAATGGLLEETLAGPAGAQSATAQLSASTNWIAQLVALRTVDVAPSLVAIPSQSSSETNTVSLSTSASDADNDPLSFSAAGLPNGLSINPATGVISGTLSYFSAGAASVTVTVTDGVLSTSQNFTWTVANVDRPPVMSALTNRTNAEHNAVSFFAFASDPDFDVLTYSATNLPGGVSINPSTGLVSGTLSYTSAGSYTVTLTVSDGTLTASQQFSWTINDVNAPPVLVNPGNQTNVRGDVVSLPVSGSDPDGAAVTFSASGLPPFLTINASSGVISGTLSSSIVGTYPVLVTVSDGTQTVSQSFTWTVTPPATGFAFVQLNYADPPSAASLTIPFNAAQTLGNLNVVAVGWNDLVRTVQSVTDTSGNVYTRAVGPTTLAGLGTQSIYYAKNIVAAAAGANSVTVTFDGTAPNPDVRIAEYRGVDQLNPIDGAKAGTGTSTLTDSGPLVTTHPTDLLFAATYNQNIATGPGVGYTQRVITSPDSDIVEDQVVTTAGSYSATAPLAVSGAWIMQLVAFRAQNQAPVVTNPGDKNQPEGTVVSVAVSASDIDLDTLTFGATGLPQGLSINTSTGLISGTLTYESAGIYSVTVTASDSSLTSSQIFTWTVTNVNRAPVLSTIANQTSAENSTVQLTLTASDPDAGDTVAFSASGLPPGLTINPSTGAITGSLSYSTAGTYNASATVSDGTLSVSQTFTWTVLNVDRPPVLVVIANQTNAEGTTVSLTVSATDPDGDPLTYNATGLPTGLSINASTGAITGSLPFTAAGTYAVTITASDGTLSDSDTFTWTVTDVNRPPTMTQMSNLTTVIGTSAVLRVSGTDPDGDAISYSATGLPPGFVLDPVTGAVTGAATSAGSFDVTASVADASLSASMSFTWTVMAPSSGQVKFIQAKASTRLVSSTSSVVTFVSPQRAGDLNLVVVAWQSASPANVGSVTDVSGNTYHLASTALNVPGVGTQAIYYASNVVAAAAGDNRVTVTFTAAASLINLRVAEYSGIKRVNVVDVATSASGSGTLVDTGNVTTTYPEDLLFAATFTPSASGLPGDSFIARLTTPLGSLIEDQAVAATGTYKATENLATSSGWIAQLVALRANSVAVVDAVPDQTSLENTIVSLQIAATDADSEPLTYSSTPLPAGLSINPSTGLISGTLTYTSAGVYSVTVTVSDGISAASRTFWWTVTNVNRPPSLTNPGNRANRFDAVVSLQLAGTDPDGTTLTYGATGLPAGLTIDPSTGLISGVPGQASIGVHAVSVTASDGSLTATQTFTWIVRNGLAVRGDFDGDGKADVTVFRRSTATWHILRSSTNFIGATSIAMGASNDIVVPGDYDGDGKEDLATFRPSTGEWTIKRSSNGATDVVVLGSPGDMPAPADYDGDGKTDVAIFHAANAQWTIRQSSTLTTITTTWGQRGDMAVPADYDGDGITDLATYRIASGLWTIRQSSNAATVTYTLGDLGAWPVPGDYDGDGKADGAIYQPSTGLWSIRLSTTGTTATTTLGGGAAVPAPGDYDGDGRTDIAVFGAAGQWSIIRSTTGTTLALNWGVGTDIPVMMLPSVYADPPLGNDITRASDFDGDGKADLAVFRKSNSTWYILLSKSGYTTSISIAWGSPGDVLVPGDYDGDGLADLATYTPSTGVWSIRLSSTGATQTITLGGSGDVPAPGDYDGDGKTDAAVFRPATALWTIRQSTTGTTTAATFGVRGDYAVPADYDGDGKTDLATYHATSSLWTILKSTTGTTTTVTFGSLGAIPVPADYDGDGKADPAVFGPNNPFRVLQSTTGTQVILPLSLPLGVPTPGDYDGDGKIDAATFVGGAWKVAYSSGAVSGTSLNKTWGTSTDVVAQMPSVVASPPFGNDTLRSSDFDGDGISDVTVYRPTTGTWHVVQSKSGISVSTVWGSITDIPVAGDYDGDGKADLAYFRPSSGLWSILQSSTGTLLAVTLGTSGDLPVPGDYDGDGKTDVAIFRPSTGLWTRVLSSTGATQTTTLGVRGDVPVPGDYDGDGKTDVAIYHPATGLWTMKLSASNTTVTATLGSGSDIPVPGDYDGDGKVDPAVFHPNAAPSALWSILKSSTNTVLNTGLFVASSAGYLPVPADYNGDGVMDLAIAKNGSWEIYLSSSGSVLHPTWGVATDVLATNLTLLNAITAMRPQSDVARQTDYDGDGKADIVVWRPSGGTWHVLKSGAGFTTSVGITWGVSTDKPVPGDYDGDGKTDPAFFRPSTGEWQVLLSTTNFASSLTVVWGASTDKPVPGDYDGDGKTDIAYYRPSTGEWQILTAASGFTSVLTYTWGSGTDVPVPGDYDGDGKTDLGVFHLANGHWKILLSTLNYASGMDTAWGISTDVPVAADYDGDGKTDLAVYRASTSSWYFLYSKQNFTTSISVAWGGAGTVQVVGDYDGDGKADLGKFTSGAWSILLSGMNYTTSLSTNWGISTDKPLPIRP